MCVCVCTVFASSEPEPGFQGDTLQLAFIDLRQVCQSSVQVCQTPVTPCQNYISHHLSHNHTHTPTHTHPQAQEGNNWKKPNIVFLDNPLPLSLSLSLLLSLSFCLSCYPYAVVLFVSPFSVIRI